MKKFIFLVLLLAAVILSACQAQAAPVQVQPQADIITPTLPAAVEAGKTTVTGRLLSETSKEPFKNTTVRLAEVQHQGDRAVYFLDGASSPGAITDEQGFFTFSNIRKADYVIVVGNPDISYAIVIDSQGSAIIYTTEEGKVSPLGDIIVNYTP
jgi:hypothetical protein